MLGQKQRTSIFIGSLPFGKRCMQLLKHFAVPRTDGITSNNEEELKRGGGESIAN